MPVSAQCVICCAAVSGLNTDASLSFESLKVEARVADVALEVAALDARGGQMLAAKSPHSR
jgi:hypothetical protein